MTLKRFTADEIRELAKAIVAHARQVAGLADDLELTEMPEVFLNKEAAEDLTLNIDSWVKSGASQMAKQLIRYKRGKKRHRGTADPDTKN